MRLGTAIYFLALRAAWKRTQKHVLGQNSHNLKSCGGFGVVAIFFVCQRLIRFRLPPHPLYASNGRWALFNTGLRYRKASGFNQVAGRSMPRWLACIQTKMPSDTHTQLLHHLSLIACIKGGEGMEKRFGHG